MSRHVCQVASWSGRLWYSNKATASDPRYHKYEKFLSDGWIPGRKIDNSDAQYHTFRGNLPYMSALLVLHPLLRKGWNAINPISSRKEAGQSRLEQRASFDCAFAVLFLFILHGVSALKVLSILYINFQIATKIPRNYVPAVTWIFNIGTLFANELCQGYHLKSIASFVAPPTISLSGDDKSPHFVDSNLMQWGAWLDSYGGLVSRWEVLFNITILRLISFNMDYYWSVDRRNVNSLEVCCSPPVFDRDLIPLRRSNSTRPICRSEIVFPFLPT